VNKEKHVITQFEFEFINIVPINDYISSCEIKVLYHGKNRNGSFISKAVGNEIANSLPRTPIVAFYNEELGDYEGHKQELEIKENEIKFISKTVPFGAVSEYGPIGWRKFEDKDGMVREYLVCQGFLWTGRYPHLKNVIKNSKSQSMEFFPESIDGAWAKFENEDSEFFIFNEASISALCILGDDIEPCFEGANIGTPDVFYSLEKGEFKQEFNNFMLELDKVLNKNLEEGGTIHNMDKEKEITTQETEFELDKTEDVVDTEVTEEFTEEEVVETAEEFTEEEVVEDAVEESTEEETAEVTEEFTAEETTEEVVEESETDAQFEILNNKFTTLETEYNELKIKYEILFNAKIEQDVQVKNALCDKFEIVGEETISGIRASLENYTIEELEDKLSAIAFKKGISFDLIGNQDSIITPVVKQKSNNAPAWLQAVEDRVKK